MNPIHYLYIFILVLTTLKLATWVAKTCLWSLHNKITFIKPKHICWVFVINFIQLINAQNMKHIKLMHTVHIWINKTVKVAYNWIYLSKIKFSAMLQLKFCWNKIITMYQSVFLYTPHFQGTNYKCSQTAHCNYYYKISLQPVFDILHYGVYLKTKSLRHYIIICRAVIFAVTHLLSKLVQAVILLTCIQVVISFNLMWNTGYPEFLIVLFSPSTKIRRFCP